MNKVIPQFNIMSEEDKKELIKILTDWCKPWLEDGLEDLENALTTEDNEQLLEVIDILQSNFGQNSMFGNSYQDKLNELTPIANKYYSKEYSEEQDRIHAKMRKENEKAEAKEAKASE